MIRRKWKYVFVGAPVVLVLLIVGWYYRLSILPVGQMQGNQFVFEGTTYVADRSLQTNQTFYFPVGKTQGGGTIEEINHEDPKDYVYVIGDMEEELYRRESLAAPPLNKSMITAIELQGLSKSHNTSVDLTTQSPQLIQELVDDLTTTDVKSWSYAIVPSTITYGIVVQLKGHPGLKYFYSLQGDSKNLYLQMDPLGGKYMNIARTNLGKWILEQTR